MKIELRNVLKTYRSLRALDHVSMQVDQGQIVSFLGPNGAGKQLSSAALRALPYPTKETSFSMTKSSAWISNRSAAQALSLARFPLLFWDQTVIRNIAIVLRVFEADAPGAEKRVLELLSELTCFHSPSAPWLPFPAVRLTRPV